MVLENIALYKSRKVHDKGTGDYNLPNCITLYPSIAHYLAEEYELVLGVSTRKCSTCVR